MFADSLAPGILLAAPTMADTFFENAVIVLLEANHEGAMGFVVNRPLELTLGDIGAAMELDVHPSYEHDHVYGGGPVTPELGWIIAQRNASTPHDIEVALELESGIILVTAADSLRILLQAPEQQFRLLLGYAGWGQAQLEGELRDGSWVTHPFDPAALFSDASQQLWQKLLDEQGLGEHLLWGKPVSES